MDQKESILVCVETEALSAIPPSWTLSLRFVSFPRGTLYETGMTSLQMCYHQEIGQRSVLTSWRAVPRLAADTPNVYLG